MEFLLHGKKERTYVLEKGSVKNINCAFRFKLNFIQIVEKPANVMDRVIFQKAI